MTSKLPIRDRLHLRDRLPRTEIELRRYVARAGVWSGWSLIAADMLLQAFGYLAEIDFLRPSTWDHAITLLCGVILLLGGPTLALYFSLRQPRNDLPLPASRTGSYEI
jgi:hypothetical protein